MQFISASDESLRTQGRITATADGGQLWVYPYTQAHFRFTGRTLAVRLRNHWNYGDIRLGKSTKQVVVDFEVGDEVNILKGAFADNRGTVTALNPEKQEATVQIMLFNREISTDIPYLELEKYEKK